MSIGSERKLLFSVTIDDCKVSTFTVKGPGGSGKDTSNTGVRITHPESGASGVGVKHRSQHKNKLEAFKKMRNDPKFKAWHLKKTRELLDQKTIEQKVDEAMSPENLKVEVRTENGWTDIQDGQKMGAGCKEHVCPYDEAQCEAPGCRNLESPRFDPLCCKQAPI